MLCQNLIHVNIFFSFFILCKENKRTFCFSKKIIIKFKLLQETSVLLTFYSVLRYCNMYCTHSYNIWLRIHWVLLQNYKSNKLEGYYSCYGEVLWFFYFRTFCPNYNLDLRSYGQLLSLFFIIYLFSFWFGSVLTSILQLPYLWLIDTFPNQFSNIHVWALDIDKSSDVSPI